MSDKSTEIVELLAPTIQSLGLDGSESFALVGLDQGVSLRQQVALWISRSDGSRQRVMLLARIDTAQEVRQFNAGGVLPYVLDSLLSSPTLPA